MTHNRKLKIAANNQADSIFCRVSGAHTPAGKWRWAITAKLHLQIFAGREQQQKDEEAERKTTVTIFRRQ